MNDKTLLLQVGYLILKEKLDEDYFRADFPNKEVHESFNKILLASYIDMPSSDTTHLIFEIRGAFRAKNIQNWLMEKV